MRPNFGHVAAMFSITSYRSEIGLDLVDEAGSSLGLVDPVLNQAGSNFFFFPICTLSILHGSTGPRIDHKSWWSMDSVCPAIRCAIPLVPRRPGAGGRIILNNPSHHQRIEERPDGHQVLPLRRPCSLGLAVLLLKLCGRDLRCQNPPYRCRQGHSEVEDS